MFQPVKIYPGLAIVPTAKGVNVLAELSVWLVSDPEPPFGSNVTVGTKVTVAVEVMTRGPPVLSVA